MKRLLVAPLLAATALGSVAAAPAHAGAQSRFEGFCGLDTVNDPSPGTETETYVGVLYARTLVYSLDPGDNPVSADVTCRVLVDGVEVDRAEFSGTTLVTGAKPTTFQAGVSQLVWLCTDIDYTSDDTPTEICAYKGDPVFPPYPVGEVLGAAIDAANAVIAEHVDPAFCQVLRSLAPGVPGTLDIDAETGDTYLAGELWWDCPPYVTGAAA